MKLSKLTDLKQKLKLIPKKKKEKKSFKTKLLKLPEKKFFFKA
jgi:hypothetical protein